jgi:hypothetical protein
LLGVPRYSAFDRFTIKAATKAAELVMAPANRREVFDQFVMTVTAVTELSEHMRRITFHAPEFTSFERAQIDSAVAAGYPRPRNRRGASEGRARFRW